MKLYEVPNRSLIQIVDVDGDVEEPIYMFYHIDGAYSYCKDADGNVVHIGASTDVKLLDIKEILT